MAPLLETATRRTTKKQAPKKTKIVLDAEAKKRGRKYIGAPLRRRSERRNSQSKRFRREIPVLPVSGSGMSGSFGDDRPQNAELVGHPGIALAYDNA